MDVPCSGRKREEGGCWRPVGRATSGGGWRTDQIRLDPHAQLHSSASTQTRVQLHSSASTQTSARLHSSAVKRVDQAGAPLVS